MNDEQSINNTETTEKVIAKDGREMQPSQLANLNPWGKGESGNPEGRPKGSKNISSCVRKFLEACKTKGTLPSGEEIEADGYEAIALKLISSAISGDLKAIREILDRLEGRPVQKSVVNEISLNDLLKEFDEPE